MIRIGIIGGAGYTAGELIRLLLNHPYAEIRAVKSESNAGKLLSEVHGGIYGDTSLKFCEDIDFNDIDLLFLCSGHGKSSEFLQSVSLPENLAIIDLAQDFRDESNGFVYGLPELNRSRIAESRRVANPGCFATAIQLALLPLAKAGLLDSDICITALTGSTGAGVKPSASTHFSWRDNNLSVYKPFRHQHLAEIGASLHSLQPDFTSSRLSFIPVRGDFPRGIFAIHNLHCEVEEKILRELYDDFYAGAPFTRLYPGEISLKDAVGTNKCAIQLRREEDRLMAVSAIDNLLKGASGQAVENMNIMFGLPETTGLKLKATTF